MVCQVPVSRCDVGYTLLNCGGQRESWDEWFQWGQAEGLLQRKNHQTNLEGGEKKKKVKTRFKKDETIQRRNVEN